VKAPNKRQARGIEQREGFLTTLKGDCEGCFLDPCPSWFFDLEINHASNGDPGIPVRIIVDPDWLKEQRKVKT